MFILPYGFLLNAMEERTQGCHGDKKVFHVHIALGVPVDCHIDVSSGLSCSYCLGGFLLNALE